MKKFSEKLKSTVLAVIALTLCIGISVNAVYSTEWTMVFYENFNSLSDGDSAEFTKTERTTRFDVNVNDDELVISSDSICYYALNDTSSYNSSENANGLMLRYTDRTIEYVETPITDNKGNSYNYHYSSDKANFIEAINGITALKCFTYATTEGSAAKSNGVRLAVDSGIFTAEDNDITIEIEYYITANDERANFKVNYPYTSEKSGNAGWVNISKSSMKIGEWATQKISVTDADFTQKANGDGDSLRISTGDGQNVIKSEFYVKSVKLYRTPQSEFSYPEKSKVAEKQISSTPVYGNIEMSFDMRFPADEKYNDYYDYNTGHNAMEVNFLDENKNKTAAIAYDFTDDSAKIYVISSDSDGETKTEIFSGEADDIMDVTLSHTITIDRENNQFSVKVAKDGSTLGNEAVDCRFRNNPQGEYRCNTQYFTVTHNPYSQALMSIFDNITVNAQEDLDYKICAEEAEHLENSINSGIVKNDFVLPSEGTYEDTVITWSLFSGSGIEIETEGNVTTARVTRPEEANTDVVLKAVVEYGEYSAEREFTFTIASLAGIGAEVGKISETVNNDGTVNASVTLRYSGVNYSEATDIMFMAVSVTSATGEIKNVGKDIQCTDVNDKYKNLTFEIESFDKKDGDKIEYYLWDKNNKSLINNAPSKVRELSSESKVTSISISWNGDGIDDNNKIDYYAIYRDGTLINVCSDTVYTDTEAADLNKHKYEIIPVDLNENTGERNILEDVASARMFTYSLGATASDKEEYGLKSQHNDSKGNVVYTTVKDKNKTESGCVYAAPGMEACFAATDSSVSVDGGITADDRNLVIRLTYLDTVGGIDMYYNSTESATKWYRVAEMENTREWKTVVINIDDAKFSLASSNADFKFMGKQDGTNYDLYIKKVEVIQAERY